MRALIFLDHLGWGGVETMLLWCMPYLVGHGLQVDICCTGSPAELDKDFEALGCRIFRIGKYANIFRTAISLEKLLRREGHTLIHSMYGYVSGGACLAGKRVGIPVIVSFHGSTPYSLFGWQSIPVLRTIRSLWLAWHISYVRRLTDVFVGHSETNLTFFAPSWRLNTAKYRFIRNCIQPPLCAPSRTNSRCHLGLRDDEVVVLHVGSFQQCKNHLGLLEIFRQVTARNPKVVLIMVGDGALRSAIEQHAAKLGLRDKVRFEGHQRNPWLYYYAADVLVFPSVTEGYGNVLVEAQVAGLPIVASDIPAHREAVAPMQRDCFFPPGEYHKAAELVCEKLKKSVQQDKQLSEVRTYTLKLHSCVRMAEEMIALYSELTSDSSRAQATDDPIHGLASSARKGV